MFKTCMFYSHSREDDFLSFGASIGRGPWGRCLLDAEEFIGGLIFPEVFHVFRMRVRYSFLLSQ